MSGLKRRLRAALGLAGGSAGDADYRRAEGYLQGAGRPHDPAMAVQWLERAAAQGHAAAQHRLSMLYLSGAKGTAPSAGWLAEAASGAGAALANARLLYPQGIDVDRDAERAFA